MMHLSLYGIFFKYFDMFNANLFQFWSTLIIFVPLIIPLQSDISFSEAIDTSLWCTSKGKLDLNQIVLNVQTAETYCQTLENLSFDHEPIEYLKKLKNNDQILNNIINERSVKCAIENGMWNTAKFIILKSHEIGKDISRSVRSSVEYLRKNANELIRILDKKHDEIIIVAPAFQWAESPQNIFLNIKFSQRWSSPGALSVYKDSFIISESQFHFSGLGTHSGINKNYTLNLDLNHPIFENGTSWNFASVGKVVVTLQKKEPAIWGNLLRSNVKLQNMQTWWDMKEKYEEINSSFLNNGTVVPDETIANSSSNTTNDTKSHSVISKASKVSNNETSHDDIDEGKKSNLEALNVSKETKDEL